MLTGERSGSDSHTPIESDYHSLIFQAVRKPAKNCLPTSATSGSAGGVQNMGIETLKRITWENIYHSRTNTPRLGAALTVGQAKNGYDIRLMPRT